jgi:hypothetical protein
LRKKLLVTTGALLLLILLLSGTLPVLANGSTFFTYSVHYEIGGYIDIDREIGKKCETGAFMTQTVKGYGEITKTETIQIADHIIAVDQKMDWSVPPGAIENLVVTTTIELCARPMTAVVYDSQPITSATGIYLHPFFINLAYPFYFDEKDLEPFNTLLGFNAETGRNVMLFDVLPSQVIYPIPVYRIEDYKYRAGDIISPYHPLVIDEKIEVKPLTKQIWETMVLTEPGNMGNYHVDFIAAYGPGPYDERIELGTDPQTTVFTSRDIMWWFEGRDPSGRINKGERYVGNYFDIQQYANTTSGEMYRLISISDPIHNLLFEDEFTVIGSAEVREAFSMNIIDGGPKAVRFDWWAIF